MLTSYDKIDEMISLIQGIIRSSLRNNDRLGADEYRELNEMLTKTHEILEILIR
jgi:hypothetical protein